MEEPKKLNAFDLPILFPGEDEDGEKVLRNKGKYMIRLNIADVTKYFS